MNITSQLSRAIFYDPCEKDIHVFFYIREVLSYSHQKIVLSYLVSPLLRQKIAILSFSTIKIFVLFTSVPKITIFILLTSISTKSLYHLFCRDKKLQFCPFHISPGNYKFCLIHRNYNFCLIHIGPRNYNFCLIHISQLFLTRTKICNFCPIHTVFVLSHLLCWDRSSLYEVIMFCYVMSCPV